MAITIATSRSKNWRVFAAFTGIGGGLLCALAGSGLTALSWLVSEPHNREFLHTLGSGVLCLTIPLLLIGACCLDDQTAAPQSDGSEEDGQPLLTGKKRHD